MICVKKEAGLRTSAPLELFQLELHDRVRVFTIDTEGCMPCTYMWMCSKVFDAIFTHFLCC